MRDPDEMSAADVDGEKPLNFGENSTRNDAARCLFELLGVALQDGKLRVVVTRGMRERCENKCAEFLVRFEAEEGRRGMGTGGNLERLSKCEREVARLVAEGCSNDEVARRLGKSVLTVKKQLRAIYQKLGVPTRARLGALLR